MKNLFFLIAIIVIVIFTACSQSQTDLPSKVTDAFNQKFPDATMVKWDKENDNEWEAEFKMEGKEYTASFDQTGVWMETEYEISVEDIPAAVAKTLETEFASYSIEKSEVTETLEGKVYEFELKKGKDELAISIDTNGNVIEKAMEEQDEESEEEDD